MCKTILRNSLACLALLAGLTLPGGRAGAQTLGSDVDFPALGSTAITNGTTAQFFRHQNFVGFPQDEITVSYWMKPIFLGNRALFSYATSRSADELLIIHNIGRCDIYLAGQSVGSVPTSGLFSGLWTHFAMTWRSVDGEAIVYVDGVETGRGTVALGESLVPGGTLVLGQDQDVIAGAFDGSQSFQGSFDNVGIFSEALAPADIALLAGSSPFQPHVFSPACRASYIFTEFRAFGLEENCTDDVEDFANDGIAPASHNHLDSGADINCNLSDLTQTSVSITGFSAGADGGSAVSGVADVNGDGFEDVLVGAPDADEAVLVLGGSAGSAPFKVTISGPADSDFGKSVSGTGDVNGDGYADMLIGAPLSDVGATDGGEVFLIFGSPTLGSESTLDATTVNGLTGVRLLSATAGKMVGGGVSGAGDVNGDGLDDLLVAATRSATPLADYLLGPNGFVGENDANWFFDADLGGAAGFALGHAILRLDADPFVVGPTCIASKTVAIPPNVILGKASVTPFFFTNVSSYIFQIQYFDSASGFIGADTLPVNSGVFTPQSFNLNVPSNAAFARFYFEMTAPTFSFNSSEFSISDASIDLVAVTGSGEANLVYGSPGGIGLGGVMDLATIGSSRDDGKSGTRFTESFISKLAGIGDFDGDGYDDLGFGLPYKSALNGEVVVVWGGPRNATTGVGVGNDGVLNLASLNQNIGGTPYSFGFSLLGDGPFLAYAGTQVFSPGDMNNDGYDDFVFGSEKFRPNGSFGQRSGVLSIRGRADRPSGSFAWQSLMVGTLVDHADSPSYIVQPRPLGDFNGDGLADLLLDGAEPVGPNATQRTEYYTLGFPPLTNTYYLISYPTSNVAVRGEVGAHMESSSAGDFNRDGVPDMVVGSAIGTGGNGRASVQFSRSPNSQGTYHNWLRHGMGDNPGGVPASQIYLNVPPRGVGTPPGGYTQLPTSQMEVGFVGGEQGMDTDFPSRQTVTINRFAPVAPYYVRDGANVSFKSAKVYWKFTTTRINFTEASLNFFFSDRDTSDFQPDELANAGVFYSAVDPASPGFNPTNWRPLQTAGIDLSRRSVKVNREFVVDGSNPGEGQAAVNGWYGIFATDLSYHLGEEIAPPPGFDVTALPSTGPEIDPPLSTFWHEGSRKLYAVQPFPLVTINWVDKDVPIQDPSRVKGSTVAALIWPGDSVEALSALNQSIFQRHIADTPPVPLNASNDDGDKINSVLFPFTETDANVGQVQTVKKFAATTAGRSLLLMSTGTDPRMDPIFFQYVWTLPREFPGLVTLDTVDVGTDLGKYASGLGQHDLNAGEPWLHNELGFYNPYEGFYNRAAAPATGPLVPVNVPMPDPDTGLLNGDEGWDVTFYERTTKVVDPLATGTAQTFRIFWPANPFTFTVQWPAAAPQIVIASQIGSGALPPETYKEPWIYSQNTRKVPAEEDGAPDVVLPGYNPNDEHALLIDQGSGPAVFALRDDLATNFTSEPYVLMAYLDPTDGDRPQMTVFAVTDTDATNDFVYTEIPARVGDRIEPPFPLRSAFFPSCPPSAPGIFDGNFTTSPETVFQDRTGAFWAISADLFPPDDPSPPFIRMNYFYPLRPDFFMPEEYQDALRASPAGIYPDDADGEPFQFNTGTCIPWLDNWQGSTAGVPMEVVYGVEWPAEAPILFAAETLARPKRGLPGIRGADSVDVIYQQSLVSLGQGKSVDLIDPTRNRYVSFAFASPGDQIAFQSVVKTVRVEGVLEFEDLAPHIRRRCVWDDNADRLIFRGNFVQFVAGEDMLLPNVMTEREMTALLALSDDVTWQTAVMELFVTTSTPVFVQPPTFEPRPAASLGVNIVDSAAGDADGDDDLDFVVVRSDGQIMELVNNLSTGEAWDIVPTGHVITNPLVDIRAKDFNGEGRDEFVVATNAASGMTIFLLVAPSGSSSWEMYPLAARAGVTGIDLGKINTNDNNFDLAVASTAGARWYQFPGLTGNWTGYNIPVTSNAISIHIGDVDGDNVNDLLVGRSDGASLNEVNWYRNDGAPASVGSTWVKKLVNDQNVDVPVSLALADVTGDGKKDVVVASSGNGTVLLFSNKDATDDFETTVAVANGLTGVNAAVPYDADGDGDVDVAMSDPNGLSWAENLGGSPTAFLRAVVNLNPAGNGGLSIFDVDADGSQDIVPGANGTSDFAWLRNDGGSRDFWDSLALTTAAGTGSGFVTLVFNNAATSAGAVTVEVIRAECPFYTGDLKTIYPNCPFNEKVALRHNGDFAGKADDYAFRWRYMPAARFLQILAANGAPPDGDHIDWTDFTGGEATEDFGDGTFGIPGAVDITVADPSGELILSDLFWEVSYRPLASTTTVCDPSLWSDWTQAGLTEGWIKRVIGDFGPFRQRATGGGIQGAEDNFVDYTTRTVNTVVSMISQAGERWEGNVPLSCNNVDELGLIETYQTVLNRGMKLSIEAAPRRELDQFIETLDSNGQVISSSPGQDGIPDAGASASVSDALLLAASRIADLYTLIGNEAYADSSDPTIAFGTDDGLFGPVATSIHPFMNQTASLLEEELKLLRGRDDSSLPAVNVRPLYNRLIWNFTNDFTGGEVAYVLNYGIADVNNDSQIDEVDAASLFPQGHGDAWGHQLTALMAYYDLMRKPEFAWVPRTEPVLVGGQPVEVDYYDERKFAALAANLARTGRDIVSLTYRDLYNEATESQWKGYFDSNSQRAWGLSEWGNRAGMGAYLNWSMANALLPPDDGSVAPTSIRKFDRAAVGELDDIASAFAEIQTKIDEANAGLNPLGIARNAVPFDISPALIVNPLDPKTHFEQVYDRAILALDNASAVFDYATQASLELRKQADNVSDFQLAVDDSEFDFKNRLIEVFGTPYPADIGPGQTYPDGYDGPDLFHWMYFDNPQVIDQGVIDLETDSFDITYITDINFQELVNDITFEFNDDDLSDLDGIVAPPQTVGTPVTVTYHISDRYGLVRPAEWTQPRRVYGNIQLRHLEVLQATGLVRKAVDDYDGFVIQLEDKLIRLEQQYNIARDQLIVLNTAQDISIGMDVVAFSAKAAQLAFGQLKDDTQEFSEVVETGLPTVVGLANDVSSPIRATIKGVSSTLNTVLGWLEVAAELTGAGADITKSQTEAQANLSIQVASSALEVQAAVSDIRDHLLNDSTLRYAIMNAEQELQQRAVSWSQTLAEGDRLLEERARFRRKASARTQSYRYKDMAFRIFRNEAVQKYRSAFDLAARYAYLAAKAYDYETNIVGGSSGSGQDFLTRIVKARSIGLLDPNGRPVVGGFNGDPGLADAMARMDQNWQLNIEGQLGFNNPQTETNRFSMRRELFRIGLEEDAEDAGITPEESDATWREMLSRPYGGNNSTGIVANLLDAGQIPEFRRYAVPFSGSPDDPLAAEEPAIVIRFGTNVNFARNFFVNLDGPRSFPLGAGDSSYDTTAFATKIRSVGVWFSDYNVLTGGGMSNTPRVYLFPVGRDIMRSPTGNRGEIRSYSIIDQAIPVPFPIGGSDLGNPDWTPAFDTLSEGFITPRRYPSFRAYHLAGGPETGVIDDGDLHYDSRLIGRSVWNTEWVLIIPGGTLHADRMEGIRRFIWGRRVADSTPVDFVLDDEGLKRDGKGVSDIRLFFQTYAYTGAR